MSQLRLIIRIEFGLILVVGYIDGCDLKGNAPLSVDAVNCGHRFLDILNCSRINLDTIA